MQRKKTTEKPKFDVSKNAPIIVGIFILIILIGILVVMFVQEVNKIFTRATNVNNVFNEEFAETNTSNVSISVKECLADRGFTRFIFIYSPTCPHCQRMMPIVDKLISEGYNITKASASSNFALVASCVNIRPVVPQFICNVNGEVIEGEVSEDELRTFYEKCR